MRAAAAFIKKEITGYSRTYKLLIMVLVFIFLGILNPLTAKFTPVLLESLMPEGMNIEIGEPTAYDSWMQFYGNLTQMGLIVLLIVFSGVLTNEVSKGTLVSLIARGLKRSTVIISKLVTVTLVWTLCYWISFVITHFYTIYFWDTTGLANIFTAALFLWLFGIILITVLLLGSVLFKGGFGALLFTGGFVVLLFFLNIIPQIAEHSPLLLASGNLELIKGGLTTEDFIIPLAAGAVISVISVIISIFAFNKKQI